MEIAPKNRRRELNIKSKSFEQVVNSRRLQALMLTADGLAAPRDGGYWQFKGKARASLLSNTCTILCLPLNVINIKLIRCAARTARRGTFKMVVHFADIAVATAFENPEQIKAWRRHFFNLESHQYSLTSQQHEQVWPFIETFWTRSNIKNDGNAKLHWYRCRLFRPQLPTQGHGIRNRKIRKGYQCKMQLKTIEIFDPHGIRMAVIYERYGECKSHNHSISDSDREKKNKALLGLVNPEPSDASQSNILPVFAAQDGPEGLQSDQLPVEDPEAPPPDPNAPPGEGTYHPTSHPSRPPLYDTVYAPNAVSEDLGSLRGGRPLIFLSGTIERGATTDWRQYLVRGVAHQPVTFLNPQRDDWDSTWREDISFEPFREQVEWEMNVMDRADIIAVYFARTTEAPITLLELGLNARSGQKGVIVCCPEGYKKKGNVQIVCARYGIEFTESIQKMLGAVSDRVKELLRQNESGQGLV